MVYEVTDPASATFVQYINTRDFSGDAEAGTAGDLAPEGLVFVDAADSPDAYATVEDDALAGIKSSARRLGKSVRPAVASFYAGTIVLSAMAMITGGAAAHVWLLAFCALHFAVQVRLMNPEEPSRNLLIFKSNVWPGALIGLAMLAL